MTAIEIIVIALAAAFVVGVIILSIVRKKQGKGSCGCDCANCQGCSATRKQPKKK